MDGYSNIYRLDENDYGGGAMLFAKESVITFSVNTVCFLKEVEIFCIELKFRKQKWLINCSSDSCTHMLQGI